MLIKALVICICNRHFIALKGKEKSTDDRLWPNAELNSPSNFDYN